MLECDRRRRQLLEAGDLQPGVPPKGHLERARQERLAGVSAGWGRTRPSSSTIDASAPSPRLIRVRPISARSAAPTDQRRTIGRSRRTPAGTCRRDALVPEAAGQGRQLVVLGQAAAALELGAEPVGIACQGGREGFEDDAGRGCGRLERQAGHAVLAQVDQAGDAFGQLDRRDRIGHAGRADIRGRVQRARRCAGRGRSCRAGSAPAAAPRRHRPRPAARRAASPARMRSDASVSARPRSAKVNGRSVGARRTGRGRGDASVIRATPPSRASPGG